MDHGQRRKEVQITCGGTAVFRRCLNRFSDGAEVISTGRPFQMQAPVIGKALTPTVDKRCDGTVSWSVYADLCVHRVDTSATQVNCDNR